MRCLCLRCFVVILDYRNAKYISVDFLMGLQEEEIDDVRSTFIYTRPYSMVVPCVITQKSISFGFCNKKDISKELEIDLFL